MYPAFRAVAQLQNEAGAQKSFNWAEEAEKVHATMYAEAKGAVESGKDVKLGNVYICEVCGWTVEGEAPDKCPLCNTARDKFRKF